MICWRLLRPAFLNLVPNFFTPIGRQVARGWSQIRPLSAAMLDHAGEERFLKPENRALVLARESPSELLRALEEWRPVRVEKWLDRETR
jgi:hypothetical protein